MTSDSHLQKTWSLVHAWRAATIALILALVSPSPASSAPATLRPARASERAAVPKPQLAEAVAALQAITGELDIPLKLTLDQGTLHWQTYHWMRDELGLKGKFNAIPEDHRRVVRIGWVDRHSDDDFYGDHLDSGNVVTHLVKDFTSGFGGAHGVKMPVRVGWYRPGKTQPGNPSIFEDGVWPLDTWEPGWKGVVSFDCDVLPQDLARMRTTIRAIVGAWAGQGVSLLGLHVDRGNTPPAMVPEIIQVLAEAMEEFREPLMRARLRALLTEWGQPLEDGEAVKALTLALHGIERPEQFQPTRQVHVVIAAAGVGTRLNHEGLPKALVEVLDWPMLFWELDVVLPLGFPVTIVGNQQNAKVIWEAVNQAYRSYVGQDQVQVLIQQEDPLGYGHSVLHVLKSEESIRDGHDVIILPADRPVLFEDTLRWLVMIHQAVGDVPLTISATQEARRYAGLELDEDGFVVRKIRLNGDPSPSGLEDAGVFIAQAGPMRDALDEALKRRALDRELDLLDALPYLPVPAVAAVIADPREVDSVNTLEELDRAERILRSLIPPPAGGVVWGVPKSLEAAL